MALRWLWVALGGLTSPAADDRKRGHSWRDFLSARKNPRGSGLCRPPSSNRYAGWPQRAARGRYQNQCEQVGKRKAGNARARDSITLFLSLPFRLSLLFVRRASRK